MDRNSPLVNAQWLFENIDNPSLLILDASLENPVKANTKPNDKFIPGALKFDWVKFCDTTSELPHMMPTEAEFMEAAQALGINSDTVLVIYDNVGVYASPRVWWMFLAMGLTKCYVLNGGLPAWLNEGYEYSSAHAQPSGGGSFKPHYQPQFFVSLAEVRNAVDDEHTLIIDARSVDRFNGKVSEPRKGLRTGHIPNSINIPFENVLLLNEMRSEDQLTKVFENISDKNTRLIFSCGSGVTACIDALAATLIGYRQISIYDGSWSEWGMDSSCPIA